MNFKIGQVFRYENKIYQVLSINSSIVIAHSYDKNCDIDSTIYISFASKEVIAKSTSKRNVIND